MSTVLSLYIASIKEFVRDRMTIFWTLAFPILFIVMFGVIFSAASTSYDLNLVNDDSGPLGQQLVQTFQDGFPGQKSVFHVKTYTSEDAAVNALKQGKGDLVLVIPAGLSDAAASPEP